MLMRPAFKAYTLFQTLTAVIHYQNYQGEEAEWKLASGLSDSKGLNQIYGEIYSSDKRKDSYS